MIRFVMVTDLSVGRNPQEVLRVLDALQTDELCPCNWKKGEQTLVSRFVDHDRRSLGGQTKVISGRGFTR